MALEWQEIGQDVVRAKIPGGWLVKVFESSDIYTGVMENCADSVSTSVALTFVPDPNHGWDGNSLP